MQLRIVLYILVFMLVQSTVSAKVYYVSSQNGSDNNTGMSITNSLKTLQKAADISKPGDTISVMQGTYLALNSSAVLNIHHSGTKHAPIVFECYHNQEVIIQLSRSNWQGVNISAGTHDIVINGFHIIGINRFLTWDGANRSRVSGLSKPEYNGTGIACSGTSQGVSVDSVADIIIENCIIQDCAQAGISTSHSDNITIRDNIVSYSCWYSSYDSSGISNWEDANVHKKKTNNWMKILGNTVFGCRDEIGTDPSPSTRWTITDGNGIIVDDSYCDQTTGVPYTGSTLISNNLVHNCGGAGIRAFNSNSVDIVNNTTYHNAESRSYADTKISCGSIASQSTFLKDNYYLGGTPASDFTGVENESLLGSIAPVPTAVFHYERKGIPNQNNDSFTYIIHEVPLRSYEIVLLFSEDHWHNADERQFNVSVNGNRWLTNFDIFAAAGADLKAIAEITHDTSDPKGDIRLTFEPGKCGNPIVNGIEVLSDQSSQPNEIDLICNKPSLIQGVYHIQNNIICPNVSAAAVHIVNIPKDCIVDGFNIYYNGSRKHPYTSIDGIGDLWINPQFINPGLGARSNFRLASNSPAIGSGLKGSNRGCLFPR